MYERAMTFAEYVAFYGLARSEGIVLRYLGDAYKALRQTVPDAMKREELTDLLEWLGEVVRQTDSSLLDEWEQLSHPTEDSDVEPVRPGDLAPRPITANARSFRVLVRNAMFRRVELAARRAYDELGVLDGDSGWDAEAWREAVETYFKEHDRIDTGPDARGPHMLLIEQEGRTWHVQQIIGDPAGDHDWRLRAEVDLDASDDAGELVLQVDGLVQL
jgi:hypothetical protein